MLFNSIEFLFGFLPIVFIGYFLLNKFKLYTFAKLFLLLASLFFYGSYKWEYVYIIIVSIFLNYSVAYIMKLNKSDNTNKLILTTGIILNILILVYFKYFNCFAEVLSRFNLGSSDIIEIIIPIGINFFTLQQISYIVDIYNKKFTNYNFIDYSLFICFFPQLLAGPIVRHQEIIPQFNNEKNKPINQRNIYVAIFLITTGLFKKTIFSDGLSGFIDAYSDSMFYNNFYTAWILGITKMFRCYFDFSGYCDIALGCGFLFNISLPWNFNSPFQANSVIEYWKKWNMTLIRFLKDYIYKPLGADKKSLLRTLFNIMFVFTVMGVWIGTNIINICSGIVSGLFVCINYLSCKLKLNINKYLSKMLTFICLAIMGQFIYVNNPNVLSGLLKTMMGINANFTPIKIENFHLVFNPTSYSSTTLNLWLLIGCFIALYFCKNSSQLAKIYEKSNNVFYTVIMAVLFVIAVIFITRTKEFLYFIF